MYRNGNHYLKGEEKYGIYNASLDDNFKPSDINYETEDVAKMKERYKNITTTEAKRFDGL